MSIIILSQHEVYIQKDLNRLNKVISGEKSRSEEQYQQYLLHKRQKGHKNKDKNFLSEQTIKDEGKNMEEPNEAEQKSESVRNENKVSTSETSQRRMSSEEVRKTDDDESTTDRDTNEAECSNIDSISPQTTYFQEANSILREVKNKFLPKGTKYEKVSKRRP